MAGKKKDEGKKSDTGKAAKGGGAKGGKGTTTKDAGDKASTAKGAQSINVRHILVRNHLLILFSPFPPPSGRAPPPPIPNLTQTHQCEKHGKKEEALAKLRDGAKFDEVAKVFSEDKARQGGALGWKTKGSLAPEFEAVAYGLENSTTAAPKYGEAKTEFGYHIIMVEGRK